MSAIHASSAADLSRLYARGDLSPVDVVRDVLARIEACEPRINAMYLVHRESALAAARESETRWRSGQPKSPIDGVPVTLKENLYTRGDPAPLGTAANEPVPRPADAPPSARVREAGCVILGKTTMPDFGMLSSGVSSIHGITRNPWRLDRNPSGSSSGAAAAAAACYGPLHVGTDIGGSVRLPATHCGLFALKPSLGRVPIDPPYMGRAAGPMTRSVGDSARLMNVLSQPDARDFMSLPYQPIDYEGSLEGLDVRGMRIALLTDMRVGLRVEEPVRAACNAAAHALEAAGAVIEPIESFLDEAMFDGIHRFFEARSWHEISSMGEAARARILPFIVQWCSWRASTFSGRDVMHAYSQVLAMREASVRAVSRYDFVLSPTSPILPYEAGSAAPGDDPHDALPHIAFTVAWNFGEQPAASINWCFTDDGLPIGVQLIGRRFDDLGVLRLARVVEQLRPAQREWPRP